MGLEDIYTELVSEHSRNPEHRHALPGATCSLKGHNPSCGDEITLQLKVRDGVVEDAAFTGVGCAISQASTDMMVDLIRGKRTEEARALAQKFIGMIKGEITDEAELEDLDEALALKGVSHMPARVKCAVLAWHTLDEALKDEK
ncbi:MAG: SUF system NifU family Fe-S cluster assembly protein [Selenomonas sp.]|nr:SUF system NifU family Fe-S cluster assembly protein [Selenomonas sp.]